jgi:hypothetical protein
LGEGSVPPLHTAADAMPRQQSIIVIVSSIVEEPFGVDMINCGEKGMSECRGELR